ncbi:protein kinase [Streptosporangiaceae bacterium NEAU-GS5]|nr:protein kinase [Streptosporangiaceae bacterium NEAU-GS5]
MSPENEPITRGSPDLPPPAPTSGTLGDSHDVTAAAADESNGLFAGPPDAPDRFELLGEGIPGGEGVTWKARYRGDLASPLPLAVKLLRPLREAGSGWPSARDVQRWRDHAVLLRHLQLEHVVRLDEVFLGAPPHPQGVQVTTDSPTEPMAYLVMEWVEGPTLHALLAGTRANRDTIRERLGYVAQAGEALASLASMTRSGGNPSLHRDVKPTNCIVHAKRGLVLIDVSTLRLIDDGYDIAGLHTPAYTAPEVLVAPHLPRDVAADVYSLGALAFFCLTGQDPPPADPPTSTTRMTRELQAVAEVAQVNGSSYFTSHIMAALDADALRRPTDPRGWSRSLLDATPVTGDETAPNRPGQPPSPRQRLAPVSVMLTLAAVATTLSLLWLLPRTTGGSGKAPTTTSSPASSVAPQATAAPEHTTGNAAKAAGAITSPADRSTVKHCSYFSGTASLPPDTTLILVKRNISTGNPDKYVEWVYGYDQPNTLATWKGAQYFGTDDDGSVGQNFQIDLVAVNLDQARRAHRSHDFTDATALAKSGVLLASVKVHRIAGRAPNDCLGPPSS